jgi:hypothetical protein
MTLQEIIQDNRWSSITFEKSTYVNRLFNSGILTRASDQAKALLDALDLENVQSTLTVGIVDSEWQEQNFGDASDDTVTSIEPEFNEVNVKTFYGNQWWAVRTIQKDLLGATKPYEVVRDRIGKYWATQWNKIISATVSGLSDIAEITVGDGTANLSKTMITQARKRKGDMGVGKLANAYMSSTTLFDIIEKQENGTISSEIIVETYGMVEIVKDGVRQMVQSTTPEYKLKGISPIVVDDSMKDGIISLVEDGAFAFEQKEFKKPIQYVNNPKAGKGAGKEEFGTKALYICHPIGFSFKGVYGTDYQSKSGLTLAELQGGGLYELKTDPKLCPITNLQVKIG